VTGLAIGRVICRGLRYAWASPNTALGLLVTLLSLISGGRTAIVSGVIETHGGFARFLLTRLVPLKGGASAMTIGHVVIGRDEASLRLTREHERVHVRQYERWGPLFLVAYFGASAWLIVRGRHGYRENPFEVEAFETSDPTNFTTRLQDGLHGRR
jgi:hypothetical protein